MDRTATMKAAIFDMDGTLIDSMQPWRALNVEFVRRRGIEPTPEEIIDLRQLTGRIAVEYYREHYGIDTDFDALCAEACEGMRAAYGGGLPLKPGAAEYLVRLRARGVKCVVCSASPCDLVLIALNRMNLVKDLDLIYSTEIVGGSKGDPSFYDRLCAMIGEKKEDCVMFVDALYAMKGAREAGLGVIGITDDTNVCDRAAMDALCDRVIDSYDELA